jgi:hypothetical protein
MALPFLVVAAVGEIRRGSVVGQLERAHFVVGC